MKYLSTIAALALMAVAIPALAETPANLARQHIDAFAAGDAVKNTVKVRYVMLYRGDTLVDEVFQVDPKMAE